MSGSRQARPAPRDTTRVSVRRASTNDAEAIARVLREAFAEYERLYTRAAYAATTPSAEAVRARLAEGPSWIAEHENAIVGTVSAIPRDDGVYVRSMAVVPAARGRRTARDLMRQVELFALSVDAGRMYLSTTPMLSDAIRVYQSLGFRRSDDPPHDLRGTPLFTMTKVLARRGTPR